MFSDNPFLDISYPAVLIVSLTSILLLIGRDWRWMIVALAVQNLGVFLLVSHFWPLSLSIVKLMGGWMATLLLGVAMRNAQPDSWREEELLWPSGRLFRLLAAGLVGLAVLSLSQRLIDWLPQVNVQAASGSLILIGMGLLLLSLTAQPLRVVLGLLTMLSGFEVTYAALESAALVAGLLAGVQLALAFTGAYLILGSEKEASQ